LGTSCRHPAADFAAEAEAAACHAHAAGLHNVSPMQLPGELWLWL
jgi:hypothetical protein